MLQHLFLWTGAIIVPSEFKCMYSTYIFLLCLYLMQLRHKANQEIASLFLILLYLTSTYMYHKFNNLVSSITFIYYKLMMMDIFFLGLKSDLDALFWQFETWRFSRALLFGVKNGIYQSEKWVIQVVGVGHLFVVSGLHVGFLYAILRVFIHILWRIMPNLWVMCLSSKKILETSLGIILIVSYGSLVGWGPAVSRASIMLLVWNLTHAFHYHISVNKLLWFAFMGILILNFSTAYSPGFWLSFVLVFLIVHMGRIPLGVPFRVGGVQVVLSSSALLMIAGWQDFVSIYTMLVNVFMIPFSAFFWFPTGFFAVIEAMLFDTYFLMSVIDVVVLFVFGVLRTVALEFQTIPLNQVLPMLFKILAMVVLILAVLFFKVRVFFVALVMAFTFLFVGRGVFPELSTLCLWPNELCANKTIVFENHNNEIVIKTSSGVLVGEKVGQDLNTSWYSGDHELNDYLQTLSLLGVNLNFLIWPDTQTKLASEVLFDFVPDMVVLHRMPSESLKQRLNALNVAWLVIEQNQSLIFEEYKEYIDIRFSGCSFLYLSVDQTLCERVEIFENMIN